MKIEICLLVFSDKILVIGHGQNLVKRRALDGPGVSAPVAGARQLASHQRSLIRQDLDCRPQAAGGGALDAEEASGKKRDVLWWTMESKTSNKSRLAASPAFGSSKRAESSLRPL